MITWAEQMQRRLRRLLRESRREERHAGYYRNGLNGPRAVSRRLQQGWP